MIEDEDDEYEGPCGIFAKEKAFREFIERKIYQESLGRFLELLVATTAIVTSVAYVVLTYIEPSPGPLEELFNKFDYVACCLFLFAYILEGYVATHRIQYIFSVMSLLELCVMLPTLIMINKEMDDSDFAYFLVPFSRYLRSIICFIIITKYFKLG